MILSNLFHTYDIGSCLPSSSCSFISNPTMPIHTIIAHQAIQIHFLLLHKILKIRNIITKEKRKMSRSLEIGPEEDNEISN